MELRNGESTDEYWNNYYSQSARKARIPSQFAAFVASEFTSFSHIVDVGCGNGRDSFFFSRSGFKVIGIDGSREAIQLCEEGCSSGVPKFSCLDVESGLTGETVRAFLNGMPTVLYARFFIHAITQRAQDIFFDEASQICGTTGVLALEFRTKRDEFQSKVTGDHYRRFIDPIDVIMSAKDRGFYVSYFTEGFGYAKYGRDDAHVARLLLKKG